MIELVSTINWHELFGDGGGILLDYTLPLHSRWKCVAENVVCLDKMAATIELSSC